MVVELEVPCRRCKHFDGVSRLGKWYHCDKFDRWIHSMQFFDDKEQLPKIYNCLEEGEEVKWRALEGGRGGLVGLEKAGFKLSGDNLYWAKGKLLKTL